MFCGDRVIFIAWPVPRLIVGSSLEALPPNKTYTATVKLVGDFKISDVIELGNIAGLI